MLGGIHPFLDGEVAKALDWWIGDTPQKLQVLRNRQADHIARHHAWSGTPIKPELFNYLQQQMFAHQEQLTRLNRLVGDQCSIRTGTVWKEEISQQGDQFLQSRFPSWEWNPDPNDFVWKPQQGSFAFPKRAKFHEADFLTIQQFLGSLCWKIDDTLGVSFVELLFLFVRRGHKFQGFPEVGTSFQDAPKHFKMAVVFIMSEPGQMLVPGTYIATEAYKCGRALPKGAIFGARPMLQPDELCSFATILLEGCGQNLATWSFPLSTCLA